MSHLQQSLLKPILMLDAVTCFAMGLLLTLVRNPLSTFTGIPVDVLLYAGLVLFPVAAFMAIVARRHAQSAAAVLFIVMGNASWVLASAWLILGSTMPLTVAGLTLTAVQAVVVAVLAVIEYRLSPSAARAATRVRA